MSSQGTRRARNKEHICKLHSKEGTSRGVEVEHDSRALPEQPSQNLHVRAAARVSSRRSIPSCDILRLLFRVSLTWESSIGVSCLRTAVHGKAYNAHMLSTPPCPRPASPRHTASSVQQHLVLVKHNQRRMDPSSKPEERGTSLNPAKDDSVCCMCIGGAGAFCSISEPSGSKNRRTALSQAKQVRMQAKGELSRW